MIISPSDCDDCRVAIKTAKALGARIQRLDPQRWRVTCPARRRPRKVYRVGESGTVLRMLLPLLPFYTSQATVEGEGTLVGRPNRPLTQALRQHGMSIHGFGPEESVPLRYDGGVLQGRRLMIDGSLSSQFISALLMACPQRGEQTRLLVRGRRLVSADYIQMTLEVLSQSGIKIDRRGGREFVIPAQQTFRGLKTFRVPSDYGLAAFLLAAGLLTESRIRLQGVFRDDLIQADGRIIGFLEQMQARFYRSSRMLRLDAKSVLKGGTFSLQDSPDLVPIMAVLALFAQGQTRLIHIRHARVKESNRITDLRQELLKIGAHVQETEDTLTIDPQPSYRPDALLDPHHDHRLAMAFAVLGLKIGVRVKDMECKDKSYPGFVRDLRRLGARLRVIK